MSALRPIAFGTLPTRQYLAVAVEREGLPEGVTSVDELHRIMTEQLRRFGPTSALSTLLERVGFVWRAP